MTNSNFVKQTIFLFLVKIKDKIKYRKAKVGMLCTHQSELRFKGKKVRKEGYKTWNSTCKRSRVKEQGREEY